MKFEIIFVSSDQNKKQFNNFYKEMPWMAIPYANIAQIKKLIKFQQEIH